MKNPIFRAPFPLEQEKDEDAARRNYKSTKPFLEFGFLGVEGDRNCKVAKT